KKNLSKSFLQVTGNENEALLFAQMATTADQEALDKLIKLLNELRDSAIVSRNDDDTHEQTSKQKYETLKASLNADNDDLDKRISEQTENKKKYAAEAEKLRNEIATHKQLKESKELELIETEKERQ